MKFPSEQARPSEPRAPGQWGDQEWLPGRGGRIRVLKTRGQEVVRRAGPTHA